MDGGCGFGADALGDFDLVLCHAVLEWLAQPQQALHKLFGLIRPGGHLSLMFYNRDALIFRNLIRGNWRTACCRVRRPIIP